MLIKDYLATTPLYKYWQLLSSLSEMRNPWGLVLCLTEWEVVSMFCPHTWGTQGDLTTLKQAPSGVQTLTYWGSWM